MIYYFSYGNERIFTVKVHMLYIYAVYVLTLSQSNK
jgi:hypothetical protein